MQQFFYTGKSHKMLGPLVEGNLIVTLGLLLFFISGGMGLVVLIIFNVVSPCHYRF